MSGFSICSLLKFNHFINKTATVIFFLVLMLLCFVMSTVLNPLPTALVTLAAARNTVLLTRNMSVNTTKTFKFNVSIKES